MSIWLPHTERHPIPVLDHGARADTKGVVIHATEGDTIEGTVSWFSGGSGGVGAHLVVDGKKAIQMVPADHKAWHAVDANAFAVGIEQVGHTAWNRDKWLNEGHLIALVANRVAWLCHQFDLGRPIHDHNVWAHAHGGAAWGGHTDPGSGYPWDRLMHHANVAYYDHWGRL